jgi:AcrR family transcriptional regulator
VKAAPQQRRSKETLHRILAAANEEFAAAGLHGVTTTAIAARAGVSVGSLYRFFADKEELAAAIVDAYLADALEVYGPILGTIRSADDIVPGLRKLIWGAAALQDGHPGYYRITQDAPPQQEAGPAAAVRNRLVDVFSEVLEQLQIGDSTAVRRRVVALVTETVRHTLAGTDPAASDRDEVIRELESMAVGYFALRLGLTVEDPGRR